MSLESIGEEQKRKDVWTPKYEPYEGRKAGSFIDYIIKMDDTVTYVYDPTRKRIDLKLRSGWEGGGHCHRNMTIKAYLFCLSEYLSSIIQRDLCLSGGIDTLLN